MQSFSIVFFAVFTGMYCSCSSEPKVQNVLSRSEKHHGLDEELTIMNDLREYWSVPELRTLVEDVSDISTKLENYGIHADDHNDEDAALRVYEDNIVQYFRDEVLIDPEIRSRGKDKIRYPKERSGKFIVKGKQPSSQTSIKSHREGKIRYQKEGCRAKFESKSALSPSMIKSSIRHSSTVRILSKKNDTTDHTSLSSLPKCSSTEIQASSCILDYDIPCIVFIGLLLWISPDYNSMWLVQKLCSVILTCIYGFEIYVRLSSVKFSSTAGKISKSDDHTSLNPLSVSSSTEIQASSSSSYDVLSS